MRSHTILLHFVHTLLSFIYLVFVFNCKLSFTFTLTLTLHLATITTYTASCVQLKTHYDK